ncbi:MAG: aminotransferase class V-fold PLP-dependent enzyme [Pirellulales bacterium]|nr:aminotransferase class V-fold PLP-dependent enzyme [Pirellulales bacterium]
MTQLPAAAIGPEDIRRQMPVVNNWVYLDNAAVAPLPEPSRAALAEWAADMAAHGAVHWSSWVARAEQARHFAAQMLAAHPDEVALVRNTTEGVNLVAEGFPWRPGDNLITLADEFPSNVFPWLNLAARGVETRLLPVPQGGLDPVEIAAACDSHTRLVAISWVHYATGWRYDLDALAEVCHRRGIYLFVDAIQGLGAFELDVSRTPVDFLAADGHKWLLGPEGAGILYLKQEHLNLLRPLSVGWNSVVHAGDFTNLQPRWKRTAARYEGGSTTLGAFAALAQSLSLLLRCGLPQVSARILALTDELCERLQRAGAVIVSRREGARRSGIVAFTLPGQNAQSLRARLRVQRIVVSCRAGWLRASPHVYNTSEELAALVETLC